jgi:hypothetical protein
MQKKEHVITIQKQSSIAYFNAPIGPLVLLMPGGVKFFPEKNMIQMHLLVEDDKTISVALPIIRQIRQSMHSAGRGNNKPC